MRKRTLIRRSAPIAALLLGLALAGPANATVTFTNAMTFSPAGSEGNFDLDMQVPNGNGASWGVASQTDWDTSNGTPHFFKVRTAIGWASHSSPSQFTINNGLINDYWTSTNPDNSNETLGWAHETPSIAYDSDNSTWVVVYSSMPKHRPDSNHIYGENEAKFGWLAVQQFPQDSQVGYPQPDLTTVDPEHRVMCGGGTTGCSDALYDDTDDWAQGTPANFNCIGTEGPQDPGEDPDCDEEGDRYYIAWVEPGVIADDAGNVWMSVTGIFDADSGSGTDYRGDVVLFKSTDSGLHWTWIAKTLDYSEAALFGGNYSFFTASSIYFNGSSVELIVTLTDINEGSADKEPLYKGMREFRYTGGDIANGTVIHDTCSPGPCAPTTYWHADYTSSIHRGAGGFYPPTGQHQMSILDPDGEGATGGLHKDFGIKEAAGVP